MQKKTYSFLIVIILIIAIIAGIFYYKNNNTGIDEETAKCIAERAVLHVSKTCGHCANQKQILGEYLDLFEIVDCTEKPEKCNNIQFIPAWYINGEINYGVKNWEDLKILTGC